MFGRTDPHSAHSAGRGLREMSDRRPWWEVHAETNEPLIHIGGRENPYMIRWAIVPRNPHCNVYLHKFLRDDDDRALHDHPWASTSILLSGRLLEIDDQFPRGRQLRAGATRVRSATYRHRLCVLEPGFSLFTTGRVVREWGFHCPEGFRHWKRYVNEDDPGQLGRGCAEYGDPVTESSDPDSGRVEKGA